LYAEPPSSTTVQEAVWPFASSDSGTREQGAAADQVVVTPRYAWTAHSSLELVPAIGQGLSRARCPGGLDVRRRSGGEHFRPTGSAHRCELRKWLQQHDVLPWRRSELPLLYEPGGARNLVAVADLACDADYAARPDEPSWRIVWHGRGAVTASDVVG
jgi:tRNA(Ile)-lysidine synthetase-like protein